MDKYSNTHLRKTWCPVVQVLRDKASAKPTRPAEALDDGEGNLGSTEQGKGGVSAIALKPAAVTGVTIYLITVLFQISLRKRWNSHWFLKELLREHICSDSKGHRVDCSGHCNALPRPPFRKGLATTHTIQLPGVLPADCLRMPVTSGYGLSCREPPHSGSHPFPEQPTSCNSSAQGIKAQSPHSNSGHPWRVIPAQSSHMSSEASAEVTSQLSASLCPILLLSLLFYWWVNSKILLDVNLLRIYFSKDSATDMLTFPSWSPP